MIELQAAERSQGIEQLLSLVSIGCTNIYGAEIYIR